MDRACFFGLLEEKVFSLVRCCVLASCTRDPFVWVGLSLYCLGPHSEPRQREGVERSSVCKSTHCSLLSLCHENIGSPELLLVVPCGTKTTFISLRSSKAAAAGVSVQPVGTMGCSISQALLLAVSPIPFFSKGQECIYQNQIVLEIGGWISSSNAVFKWEQNLESCVSQRKKEKLYRSWRILSLVPLTPVH